VADDCFAMPFVNDTHLANDPNRDPDFDRGLPRSPFQEIVTWRVPDADAFGGVSKGVRHACRRHRHGKAARYAQLDGGRTGARRAGGAKLSAQAVRKARTRAGSRIGAGFRVHGP
jgi:hypothetical protein